jgi:BarA-like signal transduction histidine kinase
VFPGPRRPHAQRRLALAAGAAAASLSLTACGSKPATRASVIARGDAICATANRALANLPPASNASGTTVDFVKAAPIVTHEATQLSALPRPSADHTVLDRFIAAESSLAAGFRHLATAQRAGNDAAVQRGLATLAHNNAASLAQKYGLRQCGAAAATVR